MSLVLGCREKNGRANGTNGFSFVPIVGGWNCSFFSTWIFTVAPHVHQTVNIIP